MYTPSARVAPLQAMIDAGKAEPARTQTARLLQKSPGDPELCATMAAALTDLGQREQAAYYAQTAVAWGGGDAAKLGAAGEMLSALGLADAAAEAYARAVQAAPGNGSVRLGQLNHLFGTGKLVDAAEAGEEAGRACPGVVEVRLLLAFALMGLGRAARTQEVLAAAAAAFPDSLAVATARASSANYLESADPAKVFELHRAFGQLLERVSPAAPVVFEQAFDPERRLRVAVISPDFRTHSISYYIEALFAHADRAQVELIGVSTVGYEDATTARLKSLAARTGGWRTWAGLLDSDLAARLRAERVDIALDIAGHSFRHALGALHLRAAPVQATYMGYPNTTGVAAVDARIVDAMTDPVGRADELATERLVRLEGCFLCYSPPSEAPGVDPVPPSQRTSLGEKIPLAGSTHLDSEPSKSVARGISFGSFNNLSKLNDRTLRLWGRVLAAARGSRLVIKNLSLGDGRVRDDVRGRAAVAGIDASRLELVVPSREVTGHLGAYDAIDIALDTIPYNGTTTTCEAMWMGVPVVTVAGEPGLHAARVGLSLLTAIGVPELVARDEAGYVRIAAELAADAPRLAAYRRSLRERMRGSVLCDGPGFAGRFVGAVREMWQERCGRVS